MYIFWPPSLLFCWCAGLAFGTGSAVAHRAVDAMLGPRVIHHEAVASPAPAAASAPSMTSSEARNACGNHSKALQDVSFLYQCFGISFSWCAWSWPDYILLYGPTFDNDLFSICARRYLFFFYTYFRYPIFCGPNLEDLGCLLKHFLDQYVIYITIRRELLDHKLCFTIFFLFSGPVC